MANEWQLQTCTVCFYVDRDMRPKMCFYCAVCDAWMCEHCQYNWGRRALASARRIAEQMRA
jgi:hypothetical protein